MDSATKPDLTKGLPVLELRDSSMIQGQVNGDDVILARCGDQFFAIGAKCSHYEGALVDGLLLDDQLRCPLHHACFSLQTGEALRAPAFEPLPCWRVERVGEHVFVREKLPAPGRKPMAKVAASQKLPDSVVIVGGGAAGLAAAEMLRREGYEGQLTMISADDSPPYDRPNVSKDFLAGAAPEEWMQLRLPNYYANERIDLLLNSRVASIDVDGKQVLIENGKAYDFDALLLATGADPVKLAIPGASDSQLFYLRTFTDGRTLANKAATAKQIVIVGASFIALEVAASLRERGIAVHIVAPELVPLERVFGREIGQFVKSLHQSHGVTFHMGETVAGLDGREVTLSSGSTVDADFLVLGVGVRPAVTLAEQAGLKTDRGVLVNEFLETSVPGIFAAGDIARWPDPHTGQSLRIEHWVVAERQGQVAARNILGRSERFDAVPYFWTSQYGVSIRSIGHVEKWDSIEIDGSLESKDCALTFRLKGRTLAVVTISRDLQNLRAEVALENLSVGFATGV